MKKALLVPLLVLLLAALLAACAPKEDYTQDPAVLDSQEYLPETVYVGALLPLSGDQAERGAAVKAAYEVAADIVNNSHDISWDVAQSAGISGYGAARMELVYRDCTSAELSAAGGVAAANELIGLGVVSLVGAYDAELTLAAARRAGAKARPLVAGAAAAAELTDPDRVDFAAYFNRVAPNAEQETAAFFACLKYLNQTADAGIAKIAMAYENTAYGAEALASFNAAAEQYGFEVVARIAYQPGLESVAVDTERLLANQPKALFQAGAGRDLALFIDAYAAAGYQPKAAFCYGKTFFSDDFKLAVKKTAADYWCGLYAMPLAAPASVDNIVKSGGSTGGGQEVPAAGGGQAGGAELFSYINSLYRAKTGEDMDNELLWEFASVIVTAQAIGALGTADSAALAGELKNASFAAPYLYSGSIDFDENGQNIAPPGCVARYTSAGVYEKVSD